MSFETPTPIAAPAFRPEAQVIGKMVGDAPSFTPRQAPAAPPIAAAPQMANYGDKPYLPDAYGLLNALTSFGNNAAGLASTVQNEQALELQQSRADYQSRFMKLATDPDAQDQLIESVRQNQGTQQVRAADEIYGNVLGQRRAKSAQQMVESGQTDFSGGLQFLTDQATQDLNVYNSRDFEKSYTSSTAKAIDALKTAQSADQAQQMRQHLKDALFVGGQTMMDAIATSPTGFDPSKLDAKLNEIDAQYGPNGDKGKLTFTEINQNRLRLAESQANQGRFALTQAIVGAGRGDNPSLLDTPQYAKEAAALLYRAQERQKELAHNANEVIAGQLDILAHHGDLTVQHLNGLGLQGTSLESALLDGVKKGVFSEQKMNELLDAQPKGFTESFRAKNVNGFAAMQAAISVGQGRQDVIDIDGKNWGPVSPHNPYAAAFLGKELPVEVARNDAVNFHTNVEIAKKNAEAASADAIKTNAVAQAASVLFKQPEMYHSLQGQTVTNAFGNKVTYTTSELQTQAVEKNLSAIADQYSKYGPDAQRDAQARWLVQGNIPAASFKQTIQTGAANVPPEAYTDPTKVPQSSLDGFKAYTSLVNAGGAALARQMAGGEQGAARYDAVRFLTQSTGTDDAGIRKAIGIVADKFSRPELVQAEGARFAAVKPPVATAAYQQAIDGIQSQGGGYVFGRTPNGAVSNTQDVAEAVERQAKNISMFSGIKGDLAYTQAAKDVAQSWRVVDGIAVPLTSTGNVPADLTAISQFVAKSYATDWNAKHPDNKIDPKDISLRPNQSQTGQWGLAFRNGYQWVDDVAAPKQWSVGPGQTFNGRAGAFSQGDLLQIHKAIAQQARESLTTGTTNPSIPTNVPSTLRIDGK